MRQLQSWIKTYLEYTETQESPELFHVWIAISVLATTLGRNVWIDRGFYKIFPNHYIVIIAASAECRKSVAVRIGMSLLEKAELVEIGAERITNAALWKWLDEAKKKSGKSEILLFSDELGLTLSRDEAQKGVISTLTRTYHCPDLLINKTKTAGIDKVEWCCVNVLAATTPTDFAEIIPGAATGTGFSSRLHTVSQENPRPRSATLIKNVELEVQLINDLKHIRMLEGEVKMTTDAWVWWQNWYEKEMKFPENEMLDSFYGRKHDYVLKLGMLLSLSEQDLLIVQKRDLTRALTFLDQLEESMGGTYSLIGSNPHLIKADKIEKQLRKAGGRLSRSQLLRKNSRQIDAEELTRIIGYLHAADKIQIEPKEGKTMYWLKEGKK